MLTVDFGSTFTKIVVVDLEAGRIVLSDKVPSTVGTDATIGMRQCFELAKTAIGLKEFATARKLATSSAAGGLRMAVSGLTRSLSTPASRTSFLGAGAKIIAHYGWPGARLHADLWHRFGEENRLANDIITVNVVQVAICLLAGFVSFPATVAFGLDPLAGKG